MQAPDAREPHVWQDHAINRQHRATAAAPARARWTPANERVFLTPESIRFGAQAVADYDERRTTAVASFEQRNGKQAGDPVKLAEALVRISDEETAPMRFTAGAMAVNTFAAKLVRMQDELETWRQRGLDTDGSGDGW